MKKHKVVLRNRVIKAFKKKGKWYKYHFKTWNNQGFTDFLFEYDGKTYGFVVTDDRKLYHPASAWNMYRNPFENEKIRKEVFEMEA